MIDFVKSVYRSVLAAALLSLLLCAVLVAVALLTHGTLTAPLNFSAGFFSALMLVIFWNRESSR